MGRCFSPAKKLTITRSPGPGWTITLAGDRYKLVSFGLYLVENVAKPLLFNAQPDATVLDKEAPNWHRLAGILDARLATSRWLTGDGVTIADIAVAAPMHMHAAQRLPLDDHSHLKRWMTQGIEQLPCWKATQAAIDRVIQAKR